MGTSGSNPSLGGLRGRRDAPTGIFQGTAQPPSPALPAGSAPLGMLVPARALRMQHRAPTTHPAGDAELTVPRHRTCSPRTASLVWPVAPGQWRGPVRPGCAWRQHMIRAAGPRSEVS